MALEGGGRTEFVAAPVERIVDVLLDVEHYPQWQAIMLDVRVQERDDAGRPAVVAFTVDAKVRKVRYVTRYTYDLPHGYRWDYVSGDLEDLRGSYRFAPRTGGTDVTVDVGFAIGFYVPGPMRSVIRDQSLRQSLRELKRRVTQPG